MRRVLSIICLLLLGVPTWALGQSRYSARSASNSGLSRRSGSFQMAPGYGYAWFRSDGLDALNARLGNSALVSQPETHGRAGYLGGYMWFPDAEFNKFSSLSFMRISDSLSASGAGATVNSNYSLWSVGAGVGVRLFPFTRGQFVPGDVSRKAKMGRRSIGFLDRMYWMGLVNLEMANLSQTYSLVVPSTTTDVKYTATAWHGVVAPTLRVAYVFHPSFHVFVEAGAGTSTPFYHSVKIDRLMVRGQDQRYRAKEAGVDEFVSAPFQVARGLVGLTVQF